MGLLARATELLEREAREKEEQALQQTALEQAALLKGLNKKPHKLRKFVLGGMLGLGLAAATAPTTLKRPLLPSDLQLTKPQRQEQVVKHNHTFSEDELKHSLQAFQRDLGSRVSSMERDMMARMVYGEAGRGADPFEVIHTVLNRMSSPLFKGTAADVITQKNQYLGYKPTNPVTSDYRRMVDIAVDEWEANGCKVDDCDHFYFVTDIPGVCNKFEVSHDHQGRWVKTSQKEYSPRQHYCHTALDQAARFFAERDGQTRGL